MALPDPVPQIGRQQQGCVVIDVKVLRGNAPSIAATSLEVTARIVRLAAKSVYGSSFRHLSALRKADCRKADLTTDPPKAQNASVMKISPLFSLLIVGYLSPFHASAQNVEERLGVLEEKVGKILAILEKQAEQTKKPTPPAPQAPGEVVDNQAADSADELSATVSKRGKKTLEKGTKLKAYVVNTASYKTPQQADPIVSITDNSVNFTIGNFLATDASKLFEKHQVGVKWEGYLWIDEPGNYTFASTYNDNASVPDVCQLAIDGQIVLQANSRQSAPAIGHIKLPEVGAYFVEIWMGLGIPEQTTSITKLNSASKELQRWRPSLQALYIQSLSEMD